MSKYIGPKQKLSRREGCDLFLKSGIRSFEEKCKSRTKPGQQSKHVLKVSNYGIQLREKQKAKRIYGITERQFLIYLRSVYKANSEIGTLLLQTLEARLDNIVYRMGFSVTRAEARQLIAHRSILVNNRVVNIPSFLVKPADSIKIHDKSKTQLRITNAIRIHQKVPCWLNVDHFKMEGTFKQKPTRKEIPIELNERLIIELYGC
ncbi:30S ribosomal protein S4 [Candidatus Tremblaya phenacola]|uniref:30S ribosomal protein S4 n=1 Tax=Candidatus Tremblayella phenacoccinincola TaxID=1010676 RepID=UPI001330C4D3|nr:30S ribosomal protein S4 [Candidatus Tremblaya phenacola]KAH0998242.1 SSU ribosomal protein S4p, zinc-independent [Candidatus Tremblaya phenacola]